MTKFWPASIMLNSPSLRPEQKLELINYRVTGISEHTLRACRNVANCARGADITMLATDGVPLHRVYLKHPTRENWLALERNVFIDTGDNFGFSVDTLH